MISHFWKCDVKYEHYQAKHEYTFDLDTRYIGGLWRERLLIHKCTGAQLFNICVVIARHIEMQVVQLNFWCQI